MTSKKINRNPALGTSFKLEIPGLESLNYMIQTCEVPGMTMSGLDAPYQKFATNVPSNRIEFDPLNLTFIVDEDYQNYESIYAWMVDVIRTEPVAAAASGMMKDITLHLTNSNKNVFMGIKFHRAYPTMLAPVPLESSTTDATAIVCNVIFRYQFFEIIRKPKVS